MGISSDTWFSSVTKEWYGTSLTPDQFHTMWQEFLSSPDVKYLPANATAEDYHRLFLQFIAPRISEADPWFAQITQAAYGNSLTDAQVEQILKSFLALPEVLSLRQPATEADYHRLYLRFIAQLILTQDPWFENATLQLYGKTTPDQLERLLLDFLASPEVLALPSTAAVEDYQRLYIAFLSSRLREVYRAEEATAVSPEAVAQSKLLYSIFEILAQMITTTSIAQIRDSEVMMYLTQKRNEYAKMLAAVPLYMGAGTVDKELNKVLSSEGVEGYVTTTNNISNPNGIKHWNSSLYWIQNDVYNLIAQNGLSPILSTVLQGQVDVINQTGQTVTYYDSPEYYDLTVSGGGYYKKLIIRVTLTAKDTFSLSVSRRSSDDGESAAAADAALTDWVDVGTFTQTTDDVVTRVTKKPVMVSSADSAFTVITPGANPATTDPNDFALGYGGITLQNLSSSLASAYAASGSQLFTLYSGDWQANVVQPNGDTVLTYRRNRLVISVDTTSTGEPRVSVTLNQDSTWNPALNPDKTVNWSTSPVSSSGLASTVATAPSNDLETITNTINYAFRNVWQAGKDAGQLQLSSTSQLSSHEQALGAAFEA
jgi:hypothetical protein